MESNDGIPSGMMPGMLGLEMPLHQQQSQQQHRHLQHQMSPFAQQQQGRHPYGMPITSKPPIPTITATTTTTTITRQHLSSYSDEEEAASGCGAEDGAGDNRDGKRGGSPWQRMKWTDEMVRLLIMVVFLVGDDCSNLDAASGDAAAKKKHPSGSAGAIQKKGKWKSVSRAMLEKGLHVSPQQCEDKFNDLNKRYKRVVDILGKGTSCRVVQNPSLLETMDHVSPKLKDEVRKLLNSKHLFFREMCAYHSSISHQPCDFDKPSNSLHQPQFPTPTDALCVHQGVAVPATDENQNDDDNDDGDDDDDDEDEESIGDGEENGGGDDKGSYRKRLRRIDGDGGSLSPIQQQLKTEMASLLQDGGKTAWEQRQWIGSRSMLLEEQKVSYQCRAFELEKQRFKWQKYSRKKEREFERLKLENERLRLENERMILVLRQKEMEIDSMIKRSEPSTITG